MLSKNNVLYKGEWKNDKKEGKFTIEYKNGRKE